MDLVELYIIKNGSCGIVYYQSIKLGTQSKLYEQNYGQMILEIKTNYI